MKTMARLITLLIVLGGWSLAALSLHVVRTPSGVALIPKNDLGVWDTYVDTRHWTLADVTNHAAVCERLIEAGHADLLSHTAQGATGVALEKKLQDAIAKAPQATHGAIDVSARAVAAANAAKRAASAAWNELNTDTNGH
jgi:hypothetical protein